MTPIVEGETIMKVSFFLLFIGIPVAAILWAGKTPDTNNHKPTLEEQYPDEHLGI